MSDSTIRKTGERIIFWVVKVVLGLLVGLTLFLIIRITPALYRATVRATHKLLARLEGWFQYLFDIDLHLFYSDGRTAAVSAAVWTIGFLPLALLVFIWVGDSNSDNGVVAFVAILAASICLGAAAGWTITKERYLHKRLTALPLEGELPPDFITPEDRSYTLIEQPTRLVVQLPHGTPFQPSTAEDLARQLRGLRMLIALEIVATQQGFSFEVIASQDRMAHVRSAILGVYPQATLTALPADEPQEPEPSSIVLVQPLVTQPGRFFAPIATLNDFKQTDPLGPVLQSLSRLETNEEVRIQLLVRRAQFPDWAKLGEKNITQGSISILNFLSFKGTFSAIGAALAGERHNRFASAEQRAYAQKLRQGHFEVLGQVEIRGPNFERAQRLAEGLNGALAQLDSDFNAVRLQPVDGETLHLVRTSVAAHSFNPCCPITEEPRLMLLTPGELASLWHLPSDAVGVPGIQWGRRSSPPPPDQPMPRGRTLLGTSVYQGVTRRVYLSDADRVTHINIVGKTGVGKSTVLHHLIQQDIVRGRGMAVIDPHGDLVNAVLETMPLERRDDVVLFDLADTQYPVGLNPFAIPPGVSRETAASRSLGVFKKIFVEHWSPTRMESALYSALALLHWHEDATLLDIPRLFHEPFFRREVMARCQDLVALDFWQNEYEAMSPGQQREMAQPILYRLRLFYRNPVVRNIICQPRQSLDFREIIQAGRIFLASLASQEVQSEAEVIGALLISQIQMAAMARTHQPVHRRRPFYLYVDEVQDFVTTSLSKMFSEARKYGLSLTVANQYLAQLEGDTLDAILGNTGTTIIFRCGVRDARTLAPFVQPVFSAQDLTDLDRFTAVVKTQVNGETLPAFLIGTPPPLRRRPDAEAGRVEIRRRVRRQHGNHRSQVEGRIAGQLGGGDQDEGIVSDYEEA